MTVFMSRRHAYQANTTTTSVDATGRTKSVSHISSSQQLADWRILQETANIVGASLRQ
jgi:hypothetical protein